MAARLLRWVIFSVLVALIPIIFTFLSLKTRGAQTSFEALVARGELVLIAAAITAAAVGELFGAGTNRFEIPKLFAGGAAIVILILASLYFADVSAVHQAGQKPDLAVVRTVSSWLFLFAVASSGSCVALAEI